MSTGPDGPGRSAGRRHSLRTKVLALLLSPVLFLLLAEAAFRIAGYDPRPEAVFLELEQPDFYVPHPRYFWTLRPRATIGDPNALFEQVRTNSLGLRGPEIPPPVPSEELRILLLGDSITFGLGLSEADNWPRHLAEGLAGNPALAGRRPVVVNAGVTGWSSVQGMRLYEDIGSEGRFDFVVFCFGMNDARPAPNGVPDTWFRAEEGPVAGVGDLLSRSRVVQLLRNGIVSFGATAGRRRVSPEEFRDAIETLRSGWEEGGPEPVFLAVPECMDVTIRELETLVDAARAAGVDLVSGPYSLVTPFSPVHWRRPPAGRRIQTDRGPALQFEGPPGEGVALAPVRMIQGDVVTLREWKQALEQLMLLLPDDHLSPAEILGDVHPAWLFQDNCHLTPPGAERIGAAVARDILRRLALR